VTEVSASNSQNKTGVAECTAANEELSAVSGGAELSGGSDGVVITETRPTGLAGETPAGWTASAVGTSPIDSDWTLTVYAVCAKVS
jgi:hypothetical protein